MTLLKKIVSAVNHWHQRHPWLAIPYAVVKKFGDDQANQYVVALGWYGFTAIFPLLLVVVTVFAYIGQASLGNGIVSTLHHFPVVGQMFNPAKGSNSLHASVLGLVIGAVGLIYGSQGVTQTALQAHSQVWNIPLAERPGFLPRLARSIVGLFTIGSAFVINAVVATYATANGQPLAARVGIVVGMLLMNWALFTASFRVLTPVKLGSRALLPGAALGAIGFTLLITVGSGLVQHQLRHSSATYGQFGAVIGLVGFLFLLAKLTLYSAELNPVLARRLWPRSLQTDDPTEADDRVLAAEARQQRIRSDQRVGVGFGPEAPHEAARDALSQRAEKTGAGPTDRTRDADRQKVP